MSPQRHPEHRHPESFMPAQWFPWLRSFGEFFRDDEGRQLVAVEEFTEDDTFVVKAELPGIDPDKDVDITISGGALHIRAERKEETEESGKHFHRRELRYGSFARTIALPEGVEDADIAASYKDGILEVRVPMPTETAKESTRTIPITRK
jgi:HSP20 family protein